MNNFKIGDKIKCIDTSFFKEECSPYYLDEITLNKTYCILQIRIQSLIYFYIKNDCSRFVHYCSKRFIKTNDLKNKIKFIKNVLTY